MDGLRSVDDLGPADETSRSPSWRSGRSASTATHTAIVRQFTQDVEARLLDRLARLVEVAGEPSEVMVALRQQVKVDAEVWAAQVTGHDERLAAEVASRIISAVYQDGPLFTPPASWWQTPFGALVVSRFGHPTARAVSLSVASAMLGITRQGVHDLVNRGKLQRDPGGGVLVSSIRDRLRGMG